MATDLSGAQRITDKRPVSSPASEGRRAKDYRAKGQPLATTPLNTFAGYPLPVMAQKEKDLRELQITSRSTVSANSSTSTGSPRSEMLAQQVPTKRSVGTSKSASRRRRRKRRRGPPTPSPTPRSTKNKRIFAGRLSSALPKHRRSYCTFRPSKCSTHQTACAKGRSRTTTTERSEIYSIPTAGSPTSSGIIRAHEGKKSWRF